MVASEDLKQLVDSLSMACDRLVQVSFERIRMDRPATAKVNSSDGQFKGPFSELTSTSAGCSG